MRLCRKCGEEKSETEFYGRKDNYRRFTCKLCHNAQSLESPCRQDPEKMRRYQQTQYRNGNKRRSRLKREFNITEGQYDELFEKQGSGCAICGHMCSTGGRLSVDHCHETGRVRGLLCKQCNLGIGNLRDDPELIRRALEYLEKGLTE